MLEIKLASKYKMEKIEKSIGYTFKNKEVTNER